MINFVCWKWKRKGRRHPAHKKTFTANHVNILYAMLERHVQLPFNLTCITDNWSDIDRRIKIIPMYLWDFYIRYSEIPGCYLRLYAFSNDAKMFLDSPFISIDLDCVIVNDITLLVENIGEFKIWERLDRGLSPYCGAMWAMEIGSRSFVWETFPGNPYIKRQLKRKNSPNKREFAPENKYGGTDQSWINMCLYDNENSWTKQDGIYEYKKDILSRGNVLPDNTTIVFFNGQHDPSQKRCYRIQWINENWKLNDEVLE